MAIWQGIDINYSTIGNWDPSNVPDSAGETAEFINNGALTSVGIDVSFEIDGFTFNAGAPTYSLSLVSNAQVEFVDAGIVNDSGTVQQLSTLNGLGFRFRNNSSADDARIIVLSPGTLQFEDTSSGGTATIVDSGGTIALLTTNGGTTFGSLETVNAAGTLSAQSGNQVLTVGSLGTSTTYAGTITENSGAGAVFGLTKVGAGILTLSGTANYTGATTVSAGTLQAGTGPDNFAQLSAFTVAAGATLDVNGTAQTIAALAGATGSNVTLGGGTLTLGDGTSTTFAGAISGSGGIVKQGAGTLTLMGDNTYTGTTVVAAGTLRAGASSTLANNSAHIVDGTLDLVSSNQSIGSLAGTGTITNSLGGLAFLQVNGSASTTFGGAITDGFGDVLLEKIGSGTLVLTGANTHSGTHVAAGTLQVDGSIGSGTNVTASGTLSGNGATGEVDVLGGGTLAPGASAGTLSVRDLSFSGGTLAIELGGSSAGQYDRVNVTGTVSLTNATLAGFLINSFTPGVGATFTIIENDDADAVSGTFNGLAEGASLSFGGSLFTISYVGGTGNDVVLSVSANDGPVNSVPGAQTVEANNDLAIAGLAVSDPDAGGGTITTTLAVAHGTLTVAPAGGAGVSGSGTATVTITGTLAEINATLAAAGNILYTPTHDFFGADTLTVTTNDNGNSGAGGPIIDTDQVTINVNTLLTGTAGNDDFDGLPGNVRIDALGGIDTITFDFALVDATVSYAGNTVVIDGPSSHTVLTGFETFVFTDGTVENDDGSPLIDDLFYYSQYHDVWNAHADADFHYNAVGWHEGRDPSAFFDTSLYLSAYPDVAAGGANPLSHFDTIGWHEARVPSLDFGAQEYLAANPDVAAANVDPLWHFLAVGASEGRQPIAPDRLIGANGFDWVYYLNTYADVKAAGIDPLQHFQTVGWMEGRNPNTQFDTSGYLATYTDVAAANINPLDHYNAAGWHEGRDPSVGFDTSSYLAAYPDVAAADVNPLMHFLAFGEHEGRSAFADGVWG